MYLSSTREKVVANSTLLIKVIYMFIKALCDLSMLIKLKR